MIADLHAHYPMHVLNDVDQRTALERMRHIAGARGWARRGRRSSCGW